MKIIKERNAEKRLKSTGKKRKKRNTEGRGEEKHE